MSNEDKFQSPIDRLFFWAAQQPDQIYLNQPIDNQTITYSWQRVAHEVACMANQLSSLPPQSKVAIISLNCAHWMMADWAIQMAGHIAVPIYPTATQKTIGYVLSHAEVIAVFVGKLLDYEHVMPTIPDDVLKMACYLPHSGLPFWDDMVANNQPMIYRAVECQNELMSIVYTSGTTGEPKGVMVSYAAVHCSMSLIKERVRITEDDRFVSYLPLAHVAERMAVEMSSLYKGAQVFFVRSLDLFVTDVGRARPTIFFGVPRIWQKMKMAVEDKLGGAERAKKILNMPVLGGLFKRLIKRRMGFSQLKFALCAAASVPKNVLEWYQDLGIKLNEAYGMTESCGLSHMTKNEDTLLGSVGQTLSGCECRISDEGEVCIRNPALMMGYYKNQVMTDEAIDQEGWLHTGDLGHIDDQGFLYITGRVKDIFKTAKGKYVAPIPVEQQLITLLPLDQVVLMGSGMGQPILVVSISEQDVDMAHYKQQCLTALTVLQTELEAHAKPSHLFISQQEWTSENGLLTPTLKIQRQHVEKHYLPLVEPHLKKPGIYII
ncbi:AMP-binding protein [Marinicella rhabdoformis]|uniref:AMP-binding protein n=1 Tax=Marinicella rhabdoformis TaxID=2580566 RepID=UPI0012AED64F|nr:AMP-binding protein [Marinicella rhabdoformis]